MKHVLSWLRKHDWPIPDDDFADCTFEHKVSEIALLRNEAASLNRLYQLRPLPGLNHVIFLVDAQHRSTPNRYALRKIAIHYSTSGRIRLKTVKFGLQEMLFITACEGGAIFVSHFNNGSSLTAKMADLGPYRDSIISLAEPIIWESISSGGGIDLDDEAYVLRKRQRSGESCSLEFLEIYAPDQLTLFRTALRTTPIDQATEDALFLLANNGNSQASELIVQLNLKKAFDVSHSIWRAYERCRPQFDDIFASVLDGLLAAMRDYRPELANRFSTYAWSRMYRYGVRGLIKGLFPITVPVYIFDGLSPILKEFSTRSDLQDYSIDELLQDRGQIGRRYELAAMLLRDRRLCFSDRVCGKRAEQSAYFAMNSVDHLIATETVTAHLTPRERDIFLLRSGLHPDYLGREHTLEEIGQQFFITRERVRQIELRARKKLARRFGSRSDLAAAIRS